ncbi:MAG TPA: hypothetical protein VJR89_19420 [Polyangiales bacterium]|nr:hypothetical protein [Polyangiales bacterium]
MTRWLWVALLFCCACTDTEGQLVAMHWSVGGDPAEREFTTDTGWQVTLEEAHAALESLFAIAPTRAEPGAVARLSRWLVPVARAHGGHDDAMGRRVRTELLDVGPVDALAEPPRSEVESAEAGRVETLKIELARSKELPSDAHGLTAYVRGTAERDGQRVEFSGGVLLADDEAARRIEARVGFELGEGGTLHVTLRPSEWFRQAEFERLPEGGEISLDNQVGRALQIGVRSPDAYEVSWKARKD